MASQAQKAGAQPILGRCRAWPTGRWRLEPTECWGNEKGENGSRTLMSLGAGLNRAQPSETDPPSSLTWDSEPLTHDLDVVGDIEVQLEPDTPHLTLFRGDVED
jgi:predicted acyl esterase